METVNPTSSSLVDAGVEEHVVDVGEDEQMVENCGFINGLSSQRFFVHPDNSKRELIIATAAGKRSPPVDTVPTDRAEFPGHGGGERLNGQIIQLKPVPHSLSSALHPLTWIFLNSDARGWIRRCQRYFALNPLNDDPKIMLAGMHLEGIAEYWFIDHVEGRNLSWSRFMDLFVYRFTSVREEDIVGEFNKLGQVTTVEKYIEKFVELRSYMMYRPLDEQYFLKSFFSGLKEDIRLCPGLTVKRLSIEAFVIMLGENREIEEITSELREEDSDCGVSLHPLKGQVPTDTIKLAGKVGNNNLVILVDSGYQRKWYKLWEKLILLWAIYSSFVTPLEFGFFRRLPKILFLVNSVGQGAFVVDIVLQFCVSYKDSQSYKMVYDRRLISFRYLRSYFALDVLSCIPWYIISKVVGRKEEVRWLILIRLTRARRVFTCFQELEKEIRVSYLFIRIMRLAVVLLYCTHTVACVMYYLATTLPLAEERNTWLGSLQLGNSSYVNFRDISMVKRYTTSLYFTIITMTTVGYGDVHAVNQREMIFIMIFVSIVMILNSYLGGNMTALIVKGSKTERYRDKMTAFMQYMDKHKLSKDLRSQIKAHLRLQYESNYTDTSALPDISIMIRAKISQSLYESHVKNILLFRDCSPGFINQIVTRVHEEFFLPGEEIIKQGDVVDHMYIICHGILEEVLIKADGSEEIVSDLEPNNFFGEIAVLCHIMQPYTVRVRDLCRLLRIDKESFSNITKIYLHDGRKVLKNLLELKGSDPRLNQVELDINFQIKKQEDELALRVMSAVYYGDVNQVIRLIQSGADPKKKDYHGRSALHLAASRGHENITNFLIQQEGVDINAEDNFGNTPLLEAIKSGHENIVSLLSDLGVRLEIRNVGSYLCTLVERGELELLRRVLRKGIDPDSVNYDARTPLHVAASQGLYSMAEMLIQEGADVLVPDRRGITPLQEGEAHGDANMISLMESELEIRTTSIPAVAFMTYIHPANLNAKSIPPCDFYFDMKYSVDYSTFSAIVTDEIHNNRNCKADLALLDMYSGCGGMSTGLCFGYKACGLDLVTHFIGFKWLPYHDCKRWAVDLDEAACQSLKLNLTETQDFLDLLKESNSVRRKYGDKRPMVRWVGYAPSDDTWEPIENLSKCPERIHDCVLQGMKPKILPPHL
ncbi:hypothetical protein CASFOL_003438 [Castilleja foliolosa]|uniref:Potassium channel n=1 Tax=Castilleja foliolosa TaxID=1961234 RepID=A0ABD3EHQ1_9LAMI